MPVSLLVDPLHLTAEELAVRGGITQMVHGDVIMNHLVQDCVLQQLFRQVETCVDTQFEVRVPPFAKEPCPMLDKRHLSKESTGIGELDRYRRQRSVEITDVILVKTGLYVIDRGNQRDLRLDIGELEAEDLKGLPLVILDIFFLFDGFGEGHVNDFSVLESNHDRALLLKEGLYRGTAETGSEDTVKSRRRTASLEVSQDGDTRAILGMALLDDLRHRLCSAGDSVLLNEDDAAVLVLAASLPDGRL